MTNLELADRLDLEVLERMPAGVVLTDADRRITWANTAFHRLLGQPLGGFVGLALDTVLRGRPTEVREGVRRHRVRDAAGDRRWLEAARCPLSADDLDGRTLHLVTDLTEFETRGPGRRATALGLDLCGAGAVLDRKGILRELGAQVSRCRRYGNPLGVLLLRFEGAAEEPTGDERRRVAARVNASVRWVDIVGATAIDELLVVMPETGAEGASRVAVKLEQALAGSEDDETPCPRAAIAIAEWTRNDDADRLLTRLQALLAAERGAVAGAA